jgi:hypothetical protein
VRGALHRAERRLLRVARLWKFSAIKRATRDIASDCSSARRRISAIYRDVASGSLLSLAEAVSPAVRRYRLIAFSFGESDTTAAGPGARSHGAPSAPSAVYRGRSGAYVHALLVYAPLSSERNEFALCHLVSRALGRMQRVTRSRAILLSRFLSRANSNSRARGRRVARSRVRSFLTLQFISATRLNLRCSRARRRRRNLHFAGSDARAKARSLINLSPRAARGERNERRRGRDGPFIPLCFRGRTGTAPRK